MVLVSGTVRKFASHDKVVTSHIVKSCLVDFAVSLNLLAEMAGEAVGRCVFTVCGPKCSLCCLVLSVWGVIMLVRAYLHRTVYKSCRFLVDMERGWEGESLHCTVWIQPWGHCRKVYVPSATVVVGRDAVGSVATD